MEQSNAQRLRECKHGMLKTNIMALSRRIPSLVSGLRGSEGASAEELSWLSTIYDTLECVAKTLEKQTTEMPRCPCHCPKIPITKTCNVCGDRVLSAGLIHEQLSPRFEINHVETETWTELVNSLHDNPQTWIIVDGFRGSCVDLRKCLRAFGVDKLSVLLIRQFGDSAPCKFQVCLRPP